MSAFTRGQHDTRLRHHRTDVVCLSVCQLLKNPDREREQKERERGHDERSSAAAAAVKQSTMKDSSVKLTTSKVDILSYRRVQGAEPGIFVQGCKNSGGLCGRGTPSP